jgi:hypothetical protein
LRPNWQDPTQYQFTKHLDNDGWAWEFLRRNEEHAKDYDSLPALPQAPATSPLSRDFVPSAVEYNPPKDPQETLHHWRVRSLVTGYDPVTTSPRAIFARKWGLIELADPSKDSTQQQVRFAPVEPYPLQPYLDQVDEYFDPEGRGLSLPAYGVLVFDLRYSLDEQLNRARVLLKHTLHHRRQANLVTVAPKAHNAPGLWVKYLRVLDADATGPKKLSAGDIAAVLFKKNPKAIKAYKPTKYERDRVYEYRKVAAHLTTQEGYESILRRRPRSSKAT